MGEKGVGKLSRETPPPREGEPMGASTKKVPFLSRLIDLSLPEIRAWKPLSMANGDNLVTGSESSPDSTKRNRGQFMVIVLVS